MRKNILFALLLVIFILGACGNKQESNSTGKTVKENDSKDATITYESEDGPIEVPADPQRVVTLAMAGNVLALDVPIVGVDSWSKDNPKFDTYLHDVEEVSEESIEKIIELNPDLIIAYSTVNNIEKLREIAPTVTYTYGKVDYLTQHIEIGKLLNKEEEATKWVNDFKERAHTTGEEIKAKIGKDTTVSVIENFNKQLYVYGDNWGRGTEILYQEMKLAMPEKVKEAALKDGYYALSSEVLPEFAGDYMILSKFAEADNSFMETKTYQNIPAVKNNHVLEADGNAFYFNDPLTLEYQLEFFTEHFLGK